MATQERLEWEFDVPSTELVEKCEEKVTHHKDRVKYWDGQHKELREKYIESVRNAAQNATEKEAKDAEQWAAAISYMDEDNFNLAGNRISKSSLGAGVPQRREIMGDPETYGELQKALAKLNEHRTEVESYTRWAHLLARDPNQGVRQLTINDAAYFGL